LSVLGNLCIRPRAKANGVHAGGFRHINNWTEFSCMKEVQSQTPKCNIFSMHYNQLTICEFRIATFLFSTSSDFVMKLTFPLIIVNCKAYEKGVGKNAVKLAKICAEVSKKTSICIALAVQPSDIHAVSQAAKIPILAQHVDCNYSGAHTGSILPEAVKAADAIGTLLNHSEKPLSANVLAKTIARCKTAKILSVVCVQTIKEAKFAEKSGADIIAIEDPKLIASNKSITEIHPALIISLVDSVPTTPVLCGAGIHTSQDAAHAIQLGTKGVLVANAVVNAKNPKKVLMRMARNTQTVSHQDESVIKLFEKIFKKQKRK